MAIYLQKAKRPIIAFFFASFRQSQGLIYTSTNPGMLSNRGAPLKVRVRLTAEEGPEGERRASPDLQIEQKNSFQHVLDTMPLSIWEPLQRGLRTHFLALTI